MGANAGYAFVKAVRTAPTVAGSVNSIVTWPAPARSLARANSFTDSFIVQRSI